ncbi:hypothetical protein GPECTOR_1086g364 [Gonium pectorale]|uniref:Uncharacterized protein n=1 Tax=Gonium pectorale TaxID=33097 RepID=A0A150FTM1_GONPE|nr:hypothetical protein GPECTOR_1086g364 [Gonium pectorale]|eukprot:KXZ40971.1 hypothetical protein GPECTOR_1086g364 [Gonium pectorale]
MDEATDIADVQPGQYVTQSLKAFFKEMADTEFHTFKGHAIKNVPEGEAVSFTVHKLFAEYAKGLIAHLSRRFPGTAFLGGLAVFDPAEYPEKLEDVMAWAEPRFAAVCEYFEARKAAAKPGVACHSSLHPDETANEFFVKGGMQWMWEQRQSAVASRRSFTQFNVEQKQVLSCLLEEGISFSGDEPRGVDELEQLNVPKGERPVHHLNVVLRNLVQANKGLFPMFIKLMVFCMLIKPTSVNCEQVFSLRTVLKTDRRTRLSPIRLGQCIFLKFNISGDLFAEECTLVEAMRQYKAANRMQLYTRTADAVEKQLHLASILRLRGQREKL